MSEYVGKFLRKKGQGNGEYNPLDGWQCKWTYKICWSGGGDRIHLVALTDGMITSRFTEDDLDAWIIKRNMVQMTKKEVIAFFEADGGGSGNFSPIGRYKDE